MQENWQFWITTAISSIALITAISAKGESGRTNKKTLEIQEKIEKNKYYPSLKFNIELIEDAFVFNIINEAQHSNAILDGIEYEMKIRAGKFNYNDKLSIKLDATLHSGNEKKVTMDMLNERINDIHSVALKEANKKAVSTSVEIRAWLHFRPAIYDGEKSVKFITEKFSYENGVFTLSKGGYI